MNRLAKFALLLSALAGATLRGAPAERPNIVIILADDLGYGSVGCFGADPKLVHTPNIDRLATEGTRFTDGSAPASVCTPSRYGLLTGRYCWRSRLKFETLGVYDPLLIEPGRPTLASYLKSQGYRTAAFGKWHLGFGTARRVDYTGPLNPGPLELGFDYFFGIPQNNGDMTGVFIENHQVYGLRSRTITPTDRKTHYGPPYVGLDAPQRNEAEVMPMLTDKAEAWLDTVPKGQPFFIYLASTAVHEPILPSAASAGTSAAGPFGDFIHDVDNMVGRVLALLEKKGLSDNTIVLFTSDNGGVRVPPGSTRNASIAQAEAAGLKMNGDWRGSKHSVYEGGFREPFIVRWPGHVKAGATAPQMVNLVDVFATVNDLLGGGELAGADDSVSFAAQLTGKSTQPARDSLILHSAKGNFAIRQGPWKYIEGKPYPAVRPAQLKPLAEEYHPQLYNLQTDPGETTDVIKEHPEIARTLQNLLDQERAATGSRRLATNPAS